MGNFETISPIPPGTVLGGRYEIQRVIGQGGMGVVYLAVDKQLNDEPRTIKTIKPELLHSPKAAMQLKKEAISSIKLTHPNIVRVLNHEEWQGTAHIVMEHIEGKALEELPAEKGAVGGGGAYAYRAAGLSCAAICSRPGNHSPGRQARQHLRGQGRLGEARHLPHISSFLCHTTAGKWL
jgi:serine/threonine protein kinase